MPSQMSLLFACVPPRASAPLPARANDSGADPDSRSEGSESSIESDNSYGPDTTWSVPEEPEVFQSTPTDIFKLDAALCDYCFRHRFAINRQRSRKKGKNGATKYIVFRCDRANPKARPPRGTKRRYTSTKPRCDCPFQVVLQRNAANFVEGEENSGWTLRAVNLEHRGHAPTRRLSEHHMWRNRLLTKKHVTYLQKLTVNP